MMNNLITLPGQFDYLRNSDKKLFAMTQIETPLEFKWPSGNKLCCKNIYFFDTRSPNGTIPTISVYQEIKNALNKLATKITNASSQILMFEKIGEERSNVVGGAFIIGNYSFYVVSDDERTEHFLCCNIYD